MNDTVRKTYGNNLRVRVCGLCIQDDSLLMVNHQGLVTGGFWAPPGGGQVFGEDARECLIREFKEETGLEIRVHDFLFVCEFISQPLHSVELFFRVEAIGGGLIKGMDPEVDGEETISEVAFLSWQKIESLHPQHRHGVFQKATKCNQILDLRGYFKL